MAIEVKLDTFQGPLDLLLHLIEKNKVDIFDIPIVQITDQYLEYINAMKEQNLDIVSEFMIMAATLIDIKCKLLLPAEIDDEGNEIDPRTELVEQLIQYKIYKYMSYELKDKLVDTDRMLFKKEMLPQEVIDYKQPINLEEIIGDVTLKKLNDIFLDVLRRKQDSIDPMRSKFGVIEKEEISVDEKVKDLKNYIKTHSKFTFKSLLEKAHTKTAVIVTFLSILELMKSGIITVSQEEDFGDINIEAA